MKQHPVQWYLKTILLVPLLLVFNNASAQHKFSIENNILGTNAPALHNSYVSIQLFILQVTPTNPADDELTPGQKSAWHKMLYGGLGITAVFVFFVLSLYIRSRKNQKERNERNEGNEGNEE